MSDMMRQMMRMQGKPVTEPWTAIQQLERMYEIETVPTDTESIDPTELDYLLVIHPKDLAEKTLYAIDQFVMKGGKLVVFVDPHALYADPAPRDPQNPMGAYNHDASSGLNGLLEEWGVRVDKGVFAGDLEIAGMIPSRDGAGMTAFLGWLKLNRDGRPGEGLNQNEVITQGVPGELHLLFPGVVETTEEVPEGVEIVPLLETTAAGNAYEAQSFDIMGFQGPDPANLRKKFTPGVTPVAMAVRITGHLPSAFEKAPGSEEAEDGAETEPTDGEGGDAVADAEDGEEKPADEK